MDKKELAQSWIEKNNLRQLPQIDIPTVHHFSSGVYAKQMHLPKGCTALSHKHTYDHLSVLASGTAVVTVDGKSTLYTAPAAITIKAGVEHEITAITPVDWFCIHATSKTDVESVEREIIQY